MKATTILTALERASQEIGGIEANLEYIDMSQPLVELMCKEDQEKLEGAKEKFIKLHSRRVRQKRVFSFYVWMKLYDR